VRCNVKLRSGKWFYEVKLDTNGLFQIGWCNTAFTPDAAVRTPGPVHPAHTRTHHRTRTTAHARSLTDRG
jgi:hypothetical protein